MSTQLTDHPILTLTNNITVRAYHHSDSPSLSHHGNNKNIWDNLRNRMPHPYTPSDAADWTARCSDPSTWVRSGPWTAATGSQGPVLPTNYVVCSNNQAIGSIGLEFNDPTDVSARSAELGYWLGQEHWGKGVMGLVVPAFTEWTWRTFGILVRLHGETKEGNLGSQRCLEKAGFVVEGRRRWAVLKNGKLYGDVWLGALRPGMVVRDGEVIEGGLSVA